MNFKKRFVFLNFIKKNKKSLFFNIHNEGFVTKREQEFFITKSVYDKEYKIYLFTNNGKIAFRKHLKFDSPWK